MMFLRSFAITSCIGGRSPWIDESLKPGLFRVRPGFFISTAAIVHPVRAFPTIQEFRRSARLDDHLADASGKQVFPTNPGGPAPTNSRVC
jgi:hypothetical protein